MQEFCEEQSPVGLILCEIRQSCLYAKNSSALRDCLSNVDQQEGANS